MYGDDTTQRTRVNERAKPKGLEQQPLPGVMTRSGSDPLSMNDKLAPKQELWQLIQAFFIYVYPIQAMAFVHRAQLTRQVEEGRASPLLLKSICAVSARFLPNADPDHVEGGASPATWCRETKASVVADADRFSTTKLAAVLCILNHEFNCGRTGSAWIFIAIAVRMARAMGLNVETSDPSMTWRERETRRRLMWSTFCADCFISAGWPEYTLITADEVRIFLPSDETSYVLGSEQLGQTLAEVMDGYRSDGLTPLRVSSGLMTRWIWLMALRARLLR